jgi:SSS family solute:Na+ symporter
MQLHSVDWAFIVGYLVLAFLIGLWFSKRASRDMGQFFIAGRSLPWWLAGTSIVATTFAVDTPLAVAGFVRSGGIYQNWFWWSVLMGGMLMVFFYARLWRRAEILTDVEFIELRYSGRPASLLRGFMALYRGVLYNCVVMGWVMVAMSKLCDVLLGWPKETSLLVLTLIALFYTVLSGFWGVVMTDIVQFVIAMFGSLCLAGIVLWQMGGPAEMVEQVRQSVDFEPGMLRFVPTWSEVGTMAMFTFAVQVTIQWWDKGQGDGYIVQRLFAARSEKDSMLAALWFNFAHYVIRPWPWIIVGVASLAFFSEGDLIPVGKEAPDYELAYPMMIAKFLPIGLKGLMVASLVAAFMSTMDTQLNWGASYLVNDLYKRFVKREAPERHYVFASRLSVVVLALLGAAAALQFESVQFAWKYLVTLTAGASFVVLLRWFWWRINPWSEISALATSFVIANAGVLLKPLYSLGILNETALDSAAWFYSGEAYAVRLLVIIAVSTIVWLLVTFLTPPSNIEQLSAFYRRVRPGGWWGPVAERNPDVVPDRARRGWPGWACGVASVYCGLFGVGWLCLGRYGLGAATLAAGAVLCWATVQLADLGRRGYVKDDTSEPAD